MKLLTINSRDICELPEDWNELTGKQLLQVCKAFSCCISRNDLIVHLMMIFSGLKFCGNTNPVMVDGIPHFYLKHRKCRIALMSVEGIAYAASPLSFLFNHEKDHLIESRLYKNKLPSFRCGFRTFYGPDHALFNIRFSEFIRLESLYEEFMKTNKPEILDAIIAILYRVKSPKADPKSPEYGGDIRVPFNDHIVEANAKVMRGLAPKYKLAIRLFYEGCRWFIFKGSGMFKRAFSNTEGTKSQVPIFQEFMSLVNSLANGDASKMETIRQTSLYDIFYELEAIAVKNEKLKEENV